MNKGGFNNCYAVGASEVVIHAGLRFQRDLMDR